MKKMINYYMQEYHMTEEKARETLYRMGYQYNFDTDEETWLGEEL